MSAQPSSRRSLRRLARIGLISAVVSLLLGLVIIWVGFVDLIDARQRVFDQMGPALDSSLDLRVAVLDQETGLRGYALTGDDRLLAPYRSGMREQAKATAALRLRFAGEPLEDEINDQLDRVQGAMEGWRIAFANPILAAPAGSVEANSTILRATDAFDQVRLQLLELESALQQEQSSARAELDATTMRLFISVGAALGLLGLVSLAASWVLRRQVVEPIDQLIAAADAVAADHLDQPIDVRGPPEIELLSMRVSEMRDRILQELSGVDTARRDLDRQALELARSNADLEQFAYVASHDLQEPLRKVASFCQLLEQRYGDQLDDRARSYIDFAVDGAKRMQALIEDLLEFSRLGRSTEKFVPCDLTALAREVLDGTAIEHVDGADIEIGELPTVPGDPSLMGLLLQNVLGNAIKYRQPGTAPEIRLSAEHRHGYWTITCADRGIGIEEPYRERVFAIFQRLHGRAEFDGTGIGLALCRKIVEFGGGRIWIEGAPDGIGTVVRWTIPDVPVDLAAAPADAASAEPPSSEPAAADHQAASAPPPLTPVTGAR